jgi:hypothetical protein
MPASPETGGGCVAGVTVAPPSPELSLPELPFPEPPFPE